MFYMIVVVVEFELLLWYEWQMEGIVEVQCKGVKFGCKKMIDCECVYQFRVEGLSMVKIVDEIGCSKGVVYKVLLEVQV